MRIGSLPRDLTCPHEIFFSLLLVLGAQFPTSAHFTINTRAGSEVPPGPVAVTRRTLRPGFGR